ncbi:MAG TPA: glycosyltransferase [Mycobacteriales bacterium]|nr:glycosyltransferase [Mycobacteriales bacterium]
MSSVLKRIDLTALRAPAKVVDVSLDETPAGAARVVDTAGYESLWCLLRSGGVPVGITLWDVSGDDEVSVDVIRAATRTEFDRHDAAPDPQPVPGLDLTVALCTRERPDDLRAALDSLSQQTDSAFSVVVVDNAPASTSTREVVEAAGGTNTRYVVEPAPGLSRARNTALAAVETPLVAWMDDDETADPQWIERVKQGFGHSSRPAAVCGLMLPAELETEAQVRFEQYGGFNKGRGLVPEVLSLAAGTVRSPMYPLPNFGAGGNMAFRVEALRAAGGFDPCLGAGTSTHGGEETRALALVLRAGGTVLHWPAAITWHYHRRELDALRNQFRGYSAGLSAFFASMWLTAPSASSRELLHVVPTALGHVRPGAGNRRVGGLPDDFPKDLLRAGRAGFLEGGVAYLRERRRHRAASGAG